MNVRSTVALALLAGLLGLAFWKGPELPVLLRLTPRPAPDSDAGTSAELAKLKPANVTRVEVNAGGEPVVLTRSPSGWAMPGGWPVRDPEANELAAAVAGISSRFKPVPLADAADLKPYGLDPAQKPVAVKLTAGEATHTLTFGSPAPKAGENPFTTPTYVRLDDKPELLRLAPGVLTTLRRPRAYYQKRQLFPEVERVKMADATRPAAFGGGEDPPAAVTLLATPSVTLRGPNGTVTLSRSGRVAPAKSDTPGAPTVTPEQVSAAWSISAPVKDAADPEKLRAVLTAVPDLWAEQFLASGDQLPDAKTGLDKPEYEVTVTPPKGAPLVLKVGKVARTLTKTPPAPPPVPGQPPVPPAPVSEEYRYARLGDNPQVFEVRADKFKELFAPLAELRDAKLARFKTADVTELTVEAGGAKPVVLTRTKADGQDRWSLTEPFKAPAETTRVSELIDKLVDLAARDKDVLDKADLKAEGLDLPKNKVVLTLTEETSPKTDSSPAKTQTRKVAFLFGRRDADKTKVSVQVQGRDRVNLVDEAVTKLIDRPALAYRGKRVFDFTPSQLASLTLKAGSDEVKLTRSKGEWALEGAGGAGDKEKIAKVADDLSRLEAVEYVADSAAPADAAKYGLDKPTATATVTYSDAAKPAQTLEVGKAREGKPEVYARIAGTPTVFAVRKETADALAQKATAFLPDQPWQVPGERVTAVHVERGGVSFDLKKEGAIWRLTGPYDAVASGLEVQPLTDALANLKAERYEAVAAKDLAAFGLDKPAVTLKLSATEPGPAKPDAKPDDPPAPEKPIEKTLLVGKPTAAGAATRFAKAADAPAVFVIGDPLTKQAERQPLDFLERQLLTLQPGEVERVQLTGPAGDVTLRREGAKWMADAKPPFAADEQTVNTLLRAFATLSAARFADYGPKVDAAKYGLDKPTGTATLTLKPGADGKPKTHSLALGKPVETVVDGPRYARLDGGPGVAVLGPATAKAFAHAPLDFADRTLWEFPSGDLASVKRVMGGQDLELARTPKGDGWNVVKPAAAKGDTPSLEELADRLSRLRAARIEALAATDVKKYGLDKPGAVVTLELSTPGGQKSSKVLEVGGPAGDAKTGDRFVRVRGASAVAVLPGELAGRLLADPVTYRDRLIVRVPDADRATLVRGPRKVTFARLDGTWKMTEPVAAAAESLDLEDFVISLSRVRAGELVAEKPKDLKPYGLDKPEADWTFYAGDKEVLHLVVGGKEKDGPRHYAKLAGGDVVFLLDAGTSARAVAEYRKRTPGPTLDAAQVDTLTLSTTTGTYVLRKAGEAWQVTGMPDRTVNAEAVNDLIAALAGLKAERYAADTKADPKLFGLQPPQLMLIAQAKAGPPLVLEIGNTEGDSKRRYARVGEKGRSDVFVIGEADAARLVREINTLAPAGKKAS
jgi:hypothetical protein